VCEEIKDGDLRRVHITLSKMDYKLNIRYLIFRSCWGVVLQTQTFSVDMPLFSQFNTPNRCPKGIDRLWNIYALFH